MNTKYDYELLEREYVTGDIGYRELARKHGIANHSIITGQAKRREWARKRAEYRAEAAEKAVVYMADAEGVRRAQEARVRDHAIEAIDEALEKLRLDMKRTYFENMLQEDGSMKPVEVPVYTLKPNEVVTLIDRLQVLFNRPSQITEERNLGINLSAAGASPELLRDIVEATRGLGAGSYAARSPLPRADRTSQN